VVGKRREPERLALQTNEQKFEEVLQQMKTFLKGAMPIPADLIRGGMGEERRGEEEGREGEREVPVSHTRERRVRNQHPEEIHKHLSQLSKLHNFLQQIHEAIDSKQSLSPNIRERRRRSGGEEGGRGRRKTMQGTNFVLGGEVFEI
jgi:hypothetical protein